MAQPYAAAEEIPVHYQRLSKTIHKFNLHEYFGRIKSGFTAGDEAAIKGDHDE
jgi:hypothetical protein